MPLISRITNAAVLNGPARTSRRVASLKAVRPSVRIGLVGRGPLAEEVRRRLASSEGLEAPTGVQLEWVADAETGPSLWLTRVLNQSIDALLIDAGPDSADQAARALERGIDVVLDGSGLEPHEATRLGRVAARSGGRLRWCTAPDPQRLERALNALARSA